MQRGILGRETCKGEFWHAKHAKRSSGLRNMQRGVLVCRTCKGEFWVVMKWHRVRSLWWNDTDCVRCDGMPPIAFVVMKWQRLPAFVVMKLCRPATRFVDQQHFGRGFVDQQHSGFGFVDRQHSGSGCVGQTTLALVLSTSNSACVGCRLLCVCRLSTFVRVSLVDVCACVVCRLSCVCRMSTFVRCWCRPLCVVDVALFGCDCLCLVAIVSCLVLFPVLWLCVCGGCASMVAVRL